MVARKKPARIPRTIWSVETWDPHIHEFGPQVFAALRVRYGFTLQEVYQGSGLEPAKIRQFEAPFSRAFTMSEPQRVFRARLEQHLIAMVKRACLRQLAVLGTAADARDLAQRIESIAIARELEAKKSTEGFEE